MKEKWFVCYSWTKGMTQGWGNCEFSAVGTLSCIGDINDIQKAIAEKEGFDNCLVHSWQRFEPAE